MDCETDELRDPKIAVDVRPVKKVGIMLVGIILLGIEQAPDTAVVAVQQLVISVEHQSVVVPVRPAHISVADGKPSPSKDRAGDEAVPSRIHNIRIGWIDGESVVIIARGPQVVDRASRGRTNATGTNDRRP